MSSFFNSGRWSFWLVIMAHVFLVLLIFFSVRARAKNPSNMNFPALFAFGDSILDAGNNNYLPLTFIKANFPPNGKNFEGKKATGRFCDGRLPTDFMVEKFGIKKSLPAYHDQTIEEEDLLTGVSFASAGSGYDPVTAALVLVGPLEVQLEWFTEYIAKIKSIVGLERTNFIVNNSIYFLVSGNCDLANTYYTVPFTRLTHDVESYTDIMLDGAISMVQNLYNKGARTIAVSNVPPLGYLPSQRTLGGGLSRSVPDHYNRGVQLFNRKLQAGLHDLRFKLYQSNIIYIDSYKFFLDIVLNSSTYGFKLVDRGCCGSGLIECAILCNWFSSVCNTDYLFWDSFHPSEKAYGLLANQILKNYFPQYL